MKSYPKTLPSLQLLEEIGRKIMSFPNRKKESKRRVHFGCFLLGYKSGLRVNEAVGFDLATKNKQGLYRIKKPKGKKERFVYVSKEIIRELKKSNWQPNQTNRWNFYHFLRKIKRELNINKNIELAPHTLRRAFATYHAEAGLPLPLLQKLLGHSSIRTTALYWRNIYSEDDKGDADTPNILTGKIWLERHKPSQNREKEPSKPTAENFPEQPPVNLESIIKDKPVIPTKELVQQDNPSLLTEIREKTITNYQSKSVISGIPSQALGNNKQIVISEQLLVIANESEKENILLAKIRNLEEQLKKVQVENNNLKEVVQSEKQNNRLLKETITNLTQKNHADKPKHTNLINAYQKVLNDRARAEKQVNYYGDQLKTIAKSLYQWQKIKHYQQLEREQKYQEAKIEQPLPFKK